jgi:hypothetical protein
MEYDPPVREKHEVSEFVRKRGRVAGVWAARTEMINLMLPGLCLAWLVSTFGWSR